MRSLRLAATLGFALLLLPLSLQAQDEPPVRGPARERLEQWRKVRIMEALKMDEETSIRFFSRYNKHLQAMREINQERNAMVDQLQAMGRSGATDAEFQKIIERLMKTEDQSMKAREAFLDEVKPILTPKQIGAYIVFERNFKRNVGEVIKELTQERMDRRQNR